jgi:uncharacterized protein (TIGR02453 family)
MSLRDTGISASAGTRARYAAHNAIKLTDSGTCARLGIGLISLQIGNSGARIMDHSTHSNRAHFDRHTIRFLRDIAENNERSWFNDNKHRYETHVLAPALSFIEKAAPELEKLSPHFVASPKRVGGSLMRIYRDTRFAKSKLPFKTNIGIQFRHERGRDVHAPGFYVHIVPRGSFVGAGLWKPEPAALRGIRMQILEQPDLWKKASSNKRFRDYFELGGEVMKRPPQGFPADAPFVDDLKRKDFIASANLSQSEVLRADFPQHAVSLLKRTVPLMSFLCAALDLEF